MKDTINLLKDSIDFVAQNGAIPPPPPPPHHMPPIDMPFDMGLLIPILGIIGAVIIPVVAISILLFIFIRNHHNERMRIIEKGIDVDFKFGLFSGIDFSKILLFIGIIVLGAASGVFIEESFGINVTGILVGLSFIICFIVNRKMK